MLEVEPARFGAVHRTGGDDDRHRIRQRVLVPEPATASGRASGPARTGLVPIVPCLFGPSLPEPLAARAVLRSSIPLEEFACLANAGRVHLRIAESPWEGQA